VSVRSTTTLLEAALLYAAIGWPVIPLHTPDEAGVCDCKDGTDCVSTGKHPRTRNGLSDATTDEDVIRRWWRMWPHANIAIDLARSGLVDIAPDCIEWFAEFTARGLPPTLRFASGGGEGHAHWLYARPEDCAIYRDTHTGEYDVLSNGYAVMPPSLHWSQRGYEWLEPKDGLILATASEAAPAWAITMLNVRSKRAETQAPADEDGGPPVQLHGDAVERWFGRQYVRRPQGGVDRSYSLWRIAIDLVDAGCRRSLIEQCLAERDMALGWEKFSGRRDAERQRRYRIIADRAVSGQGPSRAKVRASSQARVTSPPRPTGAVPLEFPEAFPTAAEIAMTQDEQIAWFAQGILGGGLITEFDGAAKRAGKTTFLLGMVRALLTGMEFIGQPTTYSPVLYLTEQSPASFRRNLARAGLLDRNDLRALHWPRAVGHDWEYIVERSRYAAQQMGARVLIVDTLGQFSGIRGEEENRSGVAMEKMEALQAITVEGLAVLVSRHDRKSGGEVGTSGRGSSAWGGVADIILHLQRLQGEQEGKEKQRLLEGIGRFEEAPEKLLIELVPGSEGEPYDYRVVGEAGEVRRESLRAEVMASMPVGREETAPTFTELRQEIGVREIELRRTLRELEAEGLIERFGRPMRFAQKVWGSD